MMNSYRIASNPDNSVGSFPGFFPTELRKPLAANGFHKIFDGKPLGPKNILNSVGKCPGFFPTEWTRSEAIL